MKNFIFIIIASLAFHCTAKGQSKFTRQNREMLKDFFLYSCIRYGFPEIDMQKKDHSAAVYIDLLRYNLEAIHKTDSVAKAFIASIEPTPYENRGTKGIIIMSIEAYKSKKIDKFITSMDVYMMKE